MALLTWDEYWILMSVLGVLSIIYIWWIANTIKRSNAKIAKRRENDKARMNENI